MKSFVNRRREGELGIHCVMGGDARVTYFARFRDGQKGWGKSM